MSLQTLSDNLRPVAPPRVIDGVYGDEQHARMVEVIRNCGPLRLIIAQHFNSLEELIATTSGAIPPGTPLEAFVSPVFRGYFAENALCLYEQVEDIFYSTKLLALAKAYWGAKYAMPTLMLFNVGVPGFDNDPGHLDSPSFRGMSFGSAPIWLLSIMGKSGLFKRWEVKKAQVITWFYQDGPGGGFTYWPDGPLSPAKRLIAPMWNRGIVSQNEAMFHRAESFGPVELRRPKGLGWTSTLRGDPDSPRHWIVETGGKVIARYPDERIRLLIHWNAEVFIDQAEIKTRFDHLDDMTPERACEILIADLKARNVPFQAPTDPLHDQAFIGTLAKAYAIRPSSYPPEAPVGSAAA